MALNKMTKSSTYSKNLKRSASKMASKIAYTTMPSLSQTVVSSKEAFNDIKQFALKGRTQLRVQNRYNKRTLLRPINEIIQNAKDDLKSGKFYNEERIAENESKSMSDFLGHMSGEDNNYESSNEGSMSSFNKFLSSTSATSMNSARAISDTQIKTAEYLGELSSAQHTQSLVMSRQQHLEQINKLDNLEKIGLSIAEFNTKTMSDHIKATHQFYNEILSETREMKKSIDSIAKNINSKYGTGSKRKVPHDAIGNVFGGGSFNLSGYFNEVKKNIGNQVPFSMDMMKGIFNDFKSSPISGLLTLASSFMMPSGIKKGSGRLDKSVQGLFAQYLGAMDQWKHGKNLSKNKTISMLQQLAGSVGAVDLTAKVNPDLSSYKNEKITLELEQKKAKAITEVIPSYLSQILKAVSSDKTEMYYNYDTGKFEDMKSARKKADNDFRKSIKYSSNDTTQFFSTSVDKLQFPNKQYKEAFEEDTETFLIYMYTNPTTDINYISSGVFYNDMIKKGMSFRLGEFSVKMLKNIWLSASPSKKREMMTEMMSNLSLVKDISNRRDVDLRSSGKSALYNNLSNLNKNKGTLSVDPKLQKKLLLESTISRDIDESDIRDFEEKRRKELNINKKKDSMSDKINSIGSKYSGTKIGGVFSKIKNRVDSISNDIDSKIMDLTDAIASKTESMLYGNIAEFDVNPVASSGSSPIKAKAVGVARKTISKNKVKTIKVKRPSSSPVMTANPTAQAVMAGAIDYRPYFETLDSHLRNIATILSQDKAIHVSGDTSSGSMTGIMSGASDKLKGLYGSGRETASKIFSSMKNIFAGASTSIKSFAGSVASKAPSAGGKAKGFLSKAKDTGLDFLSKIASGIKTTGGNVTEYLKSDSFKDLLGGMKSKITTVAGKGKELAGTLFDKLKSGGSNLLKKGKGMAIGGAISSMLGLGPIPGAIIGTLFTKNKKKKGTSEEDKQLDEMEKQEKSGGGFLDKFKAKKKKSVLLGAGISSMLGLGPIPGALLTMIYNKKLVKKKGEEKDEEKQAEGIAEGIDKAEKKSKGIGKGKKLKNLTMGAAASSLLGLGPMPGVIAASIYNKNKDKAAKKKAKEENKQAEETAEVMDEATNEKKNKKGGILSKIKNFFGKGKNLALGATASSILGLGPIPGIVVASMYNKKKYKKKNDENETLDQTTENAKDKVLSKTAESPETKAQRKKNKEYIKHAKQARDAEASGNTDKADKLEKNLFNKAESDGDINTARAAQGLVADSKNSSGVFASSGETKEKKEGLFSKLLGGLGGLFSGGLGGILGTILSIAAPALLAIAGPKILGWLKEHFGGHGTTNEQGDANFANWTDSVGTGMKTGGTLLTTKLLKKAGLNKLFSSQGAGGFTGATLGKTLTSSLGSAVSSFQASKYYSQEAEAYSDRGADTLAEEQKGISAKHAAKGAAYAINAGKIIRNSANTVVSKSGTKYVKNAVTGKWSKIGSKAAGVTDNVINAGVKNGSLKPTLLTRFKNAITSFFKNPKVVNFAKKLKLHKVLDKCKGFFTKNADNIIGKVIKGAGKAIGKLTTKLASFASVVAAWLPLATAVAAFISGYNNAPRDMGVDKTTPGFWKARLSNAIAYAIDDLLCGIPDMIGLRDWFASMLTKLMMNDEEEAEMKKSQEAQLNEYEQFLKDNDLNREGFTQDMYNKMKHKSIWGHVKSWFGADDLSKYKSGGKSNKELKEKYGGYKPTQNVLNIDASENNTVMVSDGSSGSGGRGPALTNKPTSQIIRYARDKLSQNIYSANSKKINADDVNNYVKSAQYSKDKQANGGKKGFFNELGNTITNAAKWVGGKFSSGWNWLKSTVGGWFGGSGGRGNSTNNTTNNYTYYSQKDPKWANQTFGKYNGKRDTVKEGGCGPTVAAMALENLTGKQVLPSTMANLALKAGHKYDNGGTDPEFFNTAGNLYGVGFKQTPGFNESTVNSLKAGVPVPLLGKHGPYGSGSHYILATGMDNSGKVSILDPQNRNNNKKYSMNELSNTTNSSMISTIRNCTANNKYVNKVRSIGRGGIQHIPTKKIGGRGITINRTIAANPGYKEANRSKGDIKYIVIHYAANFNGKASSAENWYNGETSAHYAVGTDGIYQTLDDKHIAYHCGGKYSNSKSYGGMSLYDICTNTNSIGIEIASNSSRTDGKGDYWFDPVAIDNAVALTNYLMDKYGITNDHVVRHFDCSGKPCPAPMVPKAYLEKEGMTVNKNHDDNAWSSFKSRLNGKSSGTNKNSTMTVGDALVAGMAALEGKIKYEYGSTNIEGGSGDCSATVQWVYQKVCGIDVGRSTSVQRTKGTQIVSPTKNVNTILQHAKPGDLLLWSDHVEMYAGDGYCWGNGSGIGTKKRTVESMISSKSSDCQVRRYTTGSESISTNLGTITDANGNKVNIVINKYFKAEAAESIEGKTYIQALLDSIYVNKNSDYAKLTSTSLLRTIGTETISDMIPKGSTTQTNSTFGTTSRTGTITLPSGLGAASTYMGWQKITSKSSNQYKLREEAGMNFDSNGMGVINGRYVVATTPKFGNVGDYIKVRLADGSTFNAIIGDIKGSDANSEWGHDNGASVVEAVVDQASWYNKKGNSAIPWYGKEITSITNEGNYWGRGGRGNTNTSILPYKIKSNIASMNPSIPDRMIYGRGGTVITDSILESSRNALNNKKAIKINKTLIDSGRGVTIDIPEKISGKSSSYSVSNNINNKEDLMIAALQNIVSLLTDIRSSNKTISEKNFSPVVGVTAGSGGVYTSNSQKSALIDNIIAGL